MIEKKGSSGGERRCCRRVSQRLRGARCSETGGFSVSDYRERVATTVAVCCSTLPVALYYCCCCRSTAAAVLSVLFFVCCYYIASLMRCLRKRKRAGLFATLYSFVFAFSG